MRTFVTYEVIDEYDPKRDYEIKISPRYLRCIALLRKGQKLTTSSFLKDNDQKFGLMGFETKKVLVFKSFNFAKRIGILKVTSHDNQILINDFAKLETVSYCLEQLRPSKRKNLKKKYGFQDSTQRSYLYELWRFHKWLEGKEFSYTSIIPTGANTFQKQSPKVTLSGLEHLLSLYKESYNSKADFVKIIKKYLLDPCHEGKKARSLLITYHAIMAYFDRNESPIPFKIDLKARYTDSKNEIEHEQSLSLEDLFKMLTVGKPTLTQKAVILCKFHRGLDTSTFVDRFNFQAWPQLVSWFGVEDFEKWDITKCPAPIKLTRIKTDFTHSGFLDRDAVSSIIDYLRFRKNKTGVEMTEDQALFLNEKNKPIADSWVRIKFFNLAKRAGIQKKIEDYVVAARYEKDSHELRDLLKSTLIECGCRYDVADHCIGHRPKDSYDKQIDLYSNSARIEFSKASYKINLFSNLSNNLKESNSLSKIKKENDLLTESISQLSDKIVELSAEMNQLKNQKASILVKN